MLKKCFVPNCGNTTSNSRKKLFILVPLDEVRRASWYRAANLEYVPKRSHVYCCEDHFDMEKDAENWQEYRLIGTRLRMKPEAVPHKFIVSPKPADLSERSQLTSSTKKRKAEVLSGLGEGVRKKFLFSDPSTKHQDFAELPSSEPQSLSTEPLRSSPVVEELMGDYYIPPTTPPSQQDKAVQYRVPYRSVRVMTKKVSTANKSTNTGTAPMVLMEVATGIEVEETTSVSSSEKSPKSSSVSGIQDIQTTSSSTTPVSDHQSDWKLTLFKMNLKAIDNNPRFYLGLPKDTFYIVKLLTKYVDLDTKHILLCLKKIRMDDSNVRLADDFFLSPSYVAKIITKGFPILSAAFKKFITWPDSEYIESRLPLPFRLNYRKVQSILDCFEVQIEVPSNPLHQALTWSDYKKCNTIKYLISSTPHGLVNFISKGFGGRTTDKVILENSQYLDLVPNNCVVMADRGFKQVAHLFEAKNASLVKPPSVSSSKKPTKEEVRETRTIAALRIHIERTIRRLREFKMLKEHSCVNKNLLHLLDSAVTIACGIINLQGPLIK